MSGDATTTADDASRLYPARPLLAVSTAVMRDERVLLASRGKPPFDAVYSLPGGLVEAGETLAEAALRELHEEVGLSARLIGPTPPVEIVVRDEDGQVARHIVVIPFAAHWIGGDATTGPEAREARWVSVDEARSLPLTPDLDRVLAEAFALRDREGQTP